MNAATSGPLSGASVRISLGTWTYTGTTNNNGTIGIISVSPDAPIGTTGVITVSKADFYNQSDSRLINQGANHFNIYLQSIPQIPAGVGASATGVATDVSVKVMNAATSGPLSGASVKITLGTWTYTGTTNNNGSIGIISVSPDAPIGTTGVITVSKADFYDQSDSRLINPGANHFNIYLQSNAPIAAGVGVGQTAVTVLLKVTSNTGAPLAGAYVVFQLGVQYIGVTDARGYVIFGLRNNAPLPSNALVTVSLQGYPTKSELFMITQTPSFQNIAMQL